MTGLDSQRYRLLFPDMIKKFSFRCSDVLWSPQSMVLSVLHSISHQSSRNQKPMIDHRNKELTMSKKDTYIVTSIL